MQGRGYLLVRHTWRSGQCWHWCILVMCHLPQSAPDKTLAGSLVHLGALLFLLNFLDTGHIATHPVLSKGKECTWHSPFSLWQNVIQWNLSWETTAMRDHLSWRTTSFLQKVLHSSVYEPVTKDHLSWETIFLWPMVWSFKTGSTVLPCLGGRNIVYLENYTCIYSILML